MKLGKIQVANVDEKGIVSFYGRVVWHLLTIAPPLFFSSELTFLSGDHRSVWFRLLLPYFRFRISSNYRYVNFCKKKKGIQRGLYTFDIYVYIRFYIRLKGSIYRILHRMVKESEYFDRFSVFYASALRVLFFISNIHMIC